MIHRIDSVNPDIDDRVIKPNQARNATNLRFAVSSTDENMSGGILVNGNEKLNFQPPAGSNTVIGTCNDYDNQVIYFAMCNIAASGPNKHGIYQIKNDAVSLIIEGEWLAFTPDMDVSIAYIDDKLYWTDGVNQPKMINILKATGQKLDEDGNVELYPNTYAEWMYTQIKRPGALPLYVTRLTRFGATSILPQYTSVDSIPYISTDLLPDTNQIQSEEGYQFSYYYIYDNYEESRLAPISIVSFFNQIDIIFPAPEFNKYVKDNNVVKEIVLVYRRGNTGTWFILKKIKNIFSNYKGGFDLQVYENVVYNNYGPTIFYSVQNMRLVEAIPVDADITDSFFDSVPIKSTCNTIALNRLFHSNYENDYNTVTGLTLKVDVVAPGQKYIYTNENGNKIELTNNGFQNRTSKWRGEKVFMFGRYKIGIELLDEYGRRIGVVATQEVTIPKPKYLRRWFDYPVELDANVYEKNNQPFSDQEYGYLLKYKVSGVLPQWVKSYRIVSTKNLDFLYFYKTQIRLFYWYTNGGQDYVSTLPVFYANDGYEGFYPVQKVVPDDEKDAFEYNGFAFKLTAGEPFIFNPDEENYVSIPQEYAYFFKTSIFQQIPATIPVDSIEYKIEKYVNGWFFVRRTNASYKSTQIQNDSPLGWQNYPTGVDTPLLSTFVCSEPPKNSYIKSDGDAWVLSRQNWAYQVYLYSRKRASEEVYYQNDNTFLVSDGYDYQTDINSVGFINGDCYATIYKKIFQGRNDYEAKFYFGGGNVTAVDYLNPGGVYVTVPNAPDNVNEYRNRNYTQEGVGFSMNPNNIFSTEWVSSIGQPSIVNEGQKENIAQNDIIPSGQIVLGSKINNLNRFNSIDAQSMPAENGPITATVITNTGQNQPGVMLAIGTLGIQSIYLGAIQQTANDGTSAITLSKNVLGSNRNLIGQYGAKRLRNITVTPESTVYWWSEVVYDLIRYTNAGMERLGKTYMFANYIRNNFANNPSIFTMYDQVTDEVLLIPKSKNAVAFNEKYKTFQGQREYSNQQGKTPDRGASLATKHYMFLDGEVWVSNINSPLNDFFGDGKTAELTIISNESPAIVKQWNQIKVYGPKPAITELKTDAESNCASFIDKAWYILRKSDYEAAIRRDVNTGTVLTGKPMESRILYSTFVFNILGFDKLNFIEVKSNKSVVQ